MFDEIFGIHQKIKSWSHFQILEQYQIEYS